MGVAYIMQCGCNYNLKADYFYCLFLQVAFHQIILFFLTD